MQKLSSVLFLMAVLGLAAQEPAALPEPKAQAQGVIDPEFGFSEEVTDQELFAVPLFMESLVPMSGLLVQAENDDLAAACTQFFERSDHEDISMMTSFIQQYPSSRWNASLMLNLGEERYERGYLSQALQYWESAWNLSKDETDEGMRKVADKAFADLIELSIRLGRLTQVEALLETFKDRPFDASVTAQIDAVRQGISRMKAQPEISFKCGPYALDRILNHTESMTQASREVIESAQSTFQGSNLLQVKQWASAAGLSYQVAKKAPGAQLIYPSVMHWKLDHFAALLGYQDGRYLVQDATFSALELWVTQKALEQETDGYFLVPVGTLPPGWSPVTDAVAATIWGKGGASGRDPEGKNSCNSPQGGKQDSCQGMAASSYYLMDATLHLMDTPVFYQPTIGPSLDFTVNYNHLESAEVATPKFSNLGPNWDFNWVSFIEVDSSLSVRVRLRYGGVEIYKLSLFNNVTSTYAPNRYSGAYLRWLTDELGRDYYQRVSPDGYIEEFSQPLKLSKHQDKAYFLKRIIDPQGHAITINYEFVPTAKSNPIYTSPLVAGQNTGANGNRQATGRINEIIDAQGNATLIRYRSNDRRKPGFFKIASIHLPADKITSKRDRSVVFTYSANDAALVKITDVVGITSAFTYSKLAKESGFITKLSTPYGDTLFQQYSLNGFLTKPDGNDPGSEPDLVLYNGSPVPIDALMRGLRVTYPDGSSGVVESWLGHLGQTFHWDHNVMRKHHLDVDLPQHAAARTENCEIFYWLMNSAGRFITAVPYRHRTPLKHETNYDYAGVTKVDIKDEEDDTVIGAHYFAGDTNNPTATTQGGVLLDSRSYNLLGNVTSQKDPMNRETLYHYAGNGMDLMEVRQVTGLDSDLLMKMEYNHLHQPTRVWNAAGMRTTLDYDPIDVAEKVLKPVRVIQEGDPSTPTDDVVINLDYDPTNFQLQTVNGPLPGDQDVTRYTYDGYDRLQSVTTPDGASVSYTYDRLNRLVTTTYRQPTEPGQPPVEEYEEIVYDRLDPVLIRDRKGRLTTIQYNSMRKPSIITDSEGKKLLLEWCTCGSLSRLTDGNGNVTEWLYDVMGRLTKKIREDGRQELYLYDELSGRLESITLGGKVRKSFLYNADGSLMRVMYARFNTTSEQWELAADTPEVNFFYDPVYPRLTKVQTALNESRYFYYPYRKQNWQVDRNAGALLCVQETSQQAETVFEYDFFGRVKKRHVDSVLDQAVTLPGQGQVLELNYDVVGRMTSHLDSLGTFAYTYLTLPSATGSGELVDLGSGLLDTVTYPGGQQTRYDYHPSQQWRSLKEISHRTAPAGGGSLISQFNYQYTPEGTLSGWTQAQGLPTAATRHWDLEHDESEQLTAVLERPSAGHADLLSQLYFVYDAAGNRVSQQTDNAITKTHFNAMNQIIQRPVGGKVRFQGRLDEVGKVTVGPLQAKTTVRYLEKPAEEEGAAPVRVPQSHFQVDLDLQSGLNNVTVQAVDRAGLTTTQEYAMTLTQGTQGGVPQYDTLGNMVHDGGGRSFQWDAENRLLAVVYADGSRTEWRYDGQGRRIWEVERNAQGVELSRKGRVWVGVKCVQERSGTGVFTRKHAAYGWLERSGTGSSQTTTSYVTTHDHLGSVREVRNQSTGVLVARYSYGPYGEQPSTAYEGAGNSPRRYTGHDYHAKSGLHLALYRAYDAGMGVWLSEDPLGEEGGLNLYGYVGNNPLMMIDPLGLDWVNLTGDPAFDLIGPKLPGSSDPHTLNVIAHGNNKSIQDDRSQYLEERRIMDAKDFRDFLNNEHGEDPYDNINFYSCNSANTTGTTKKSHPYVYSPVEKSFAELVHELTGLATSGANGFTFPQYDGTEKIYSDYIDHQGAGLPRERIHFPPCKK